VQCDRGFNIIENFKAQMSYRLQTCVTTLNKNLIA